MATVAGAGATVDVLISHHIPGAKRFSTERQHPISQRRAARETIQKWDHRLWMRTVAAPVQSAERDATKMTAAIEDWNTL
ncbi:unnamed protein product [Callosobruchus maculatus]|uniref:Uncharacterized protein n=1 Tax=Callosobruchus maculatus TaxID=64391 RepID=A0A653CBB2_CALMS|nr:unnamed protein product [Callosobruchus maculatus]